MELLGLLLREALLRVGDVLAFAWLAQVELRVQHDLAAALRVLLHCQFVEAHLGGLLGKLEAIALHAWEEVSV